MKIKTKITNVTHDDLVNLLSTAEYGSSWLGICYDSSEYNAIPNLPESECIEDKCARLLLNGKSIVLYDMNADDSEDYYGKLPHSWDEENQTMDYTVTLKDIVKGIEEALNNGKWDAECATNLINADDGNLDQPQAENLVQIILFGESIYG